MEGHKFGKPHFSQSCDRLLLRINELNEMATDREASFLDEHDSNEYWASVRNSQEVHPETYVELPIE